MRTFTGHWCYAALLFATCPLMTSTAAAQSATELVTVTADGKSAGGMSERPSISQDGRFVAFTSKSTKLVLGPSPAHADVFVRDRLGGHTVRASVGLNGVLSNGYSYNPSISADGRYVAFASEASNLVTGDTNGQIDVFVHDLQTGLTELVSQTGSGVLGNSQSDTSVSRAISRDGRFVVFSSYATNLHPDAHSTAGDVYVKDRLTGQLELVNVDDQGRKAADLSMGGTIDESGLVVAFMSDGAALVPGDTNATIDIFVRDRVARTTTRASVATNGTEGDSYSAWPNLSGDGRYVAFYSSSSTFVPGDTNGTDDVFVHDLASGVTERVSVSTAGVQPNVQTVGGPLSFDGRFVVFESYATNLIPGPSNPFRTADILVRDRLLHRTFRVSDGLAATLANESAFDPMLSSDGRYAAFGSAASNLVRNDFNDTGDIFVRDLLPPYAFTLKPSPLAFGPVQVGTALTRNLWLANKGTETLPIDSVSLRGTERAMFRARSKCGASVAPGTGCAITVTFSPTSIGPKAAVVRLVAAGFVRRVEIAGTGD